VCLILLAADPSDAVALVVAANRDEEHARPTRSAHGWGAETGVFGGRDLVSGGTWLGATPGGRLAALTNVRAPGARRQGRSRGELPVRFLLGDGDVTTFARSLEPELAAYPAFNLVVGSPQGGFFHWSDEGGAPVRIGPGVHGLSNARFDAAWPKVERGRGAMQAALHLPEAARDTALFEALADETIAGDAALPTTGVPIEIERLLSPAFIRGPVYGTRCSTVVVVYRDGSVMFEERSFGPGGSAAGPPVRHQLPATPT